MKMLIPVVPNGVSNPKGSHFMKRRILTTLAGMSLLISAGIATPVVAATKAPTWHGLSRIAPSLGATNDISCTSTTCFAATDAGLMTTSDYAAWAWSSNTTMATTPLYYIDCDGAGSTCVAGALGGRLFITANNGTSWSANTSLLSRMPAKSSLDHLTCRANQFCLAVTSTSVPTLLRATLSGGTLGAWSIVTTPSLKYMDNVVCTSDANCLMIGMSTKSAILTSGDGGLTWTKLSAQQYSNPQLTLTCSPGTSSVCLLAGSQSPTMLSGSSGVLARSSDSGHTWSTVTLPSDVSSFDVQGCLSASLCIAQQTKTVSGTDSYATVESTDGGATWTTAGSLPEIFQVQSSLFGSGSSGALYCLDGVRCIAASMDWSMPLESSVTTNFSTWSAMTYSSASSVVMGMSCVSATTCMTLSSPTGSGNSVSDPFDAYITTNGGTSWTFRSHLPSWVGYVNDSSLTCLSATSCILVGATASKSPFLLTSTDGMATWTSASLGSVNDATGQLKSVSCAGTHCVAAGYTVTSTDLNALAVSSNDSGATWSRVTGLSSGALFSVSCATAASCLAVGYAKVGNGYQPIVYGTSNGSTWTLRSQGTKGGVWMSVQCTSATNCVLVGADGNLKGEIATTSSGATFTASYFPKVAFAGLSCRQTLCVASSFDPYSKTAATFYTSTNSGAKFTVTKGTVKPFTTDAPQAISCATTTFCLATTARGAFAAFKP